MRSVLTAVIAAIEAAAVALAVFAVIGIPAVLIWWLGFDLAAEPSELASIVAALWQLAHLAPMQISLTAQASLDLGLSAEALTFTLSLAPLGLTFMTAAFAYFAGVRAARRGGAGAWAIAGGSVGFAAAATLTAMSAAGYGLWPMWARIAVPVLVYAVPMVFGFVLRSALEGEDWWAATMRSVQQQAERLAPKSATFLPERAAEVMRLVGVGTAAIVGLGCLGFCIALVAGYIDIVTLSQGLQLDAPGILMLFLLQLVFLPVAWIWAISWFAGPGFAVGAATSVSPFETLLGPLPALPLFGSIPEGWGWAGGFAPVIVVVIGTVLGGFVGGRSTLRRGSALVSVIVPLCAAVIVGMIVMLLALIAGGAIGPQRLAETGPQVWQTGALVALELAFGMTLGVFARRVDVDRWREVVPFGGDSAGGPAGRSGASFDMAERGGFFGLGDKGRSSVDAEHTDLDSSKYEQTDLDDTRPIVPLQSVRVEPLAAQTGDSADHAETIPIDPLPAEARDIESHFDPETAPEPEPEPAQVSEPEPEPEPEPDPEPEDAVDPLLKAFSWDAKVDEQPESAPESGWRARLRSRLDRD